MNDKSMVDLIKSIVYSLEDLKTVDSVTADAVEELSKITETNLVKIYERLNSMQAVINSQEQRIRELEVLNG